MIWLLVWYSEIRLRQILFGVNLNAFLVVLIIKFLFGTISSIGCVINWLLRLLLLCNEKIVCNWLALLPMLPLATDEEHEQQSSSMWFCELSNLQVSPLNALSSFNLTIVGSLICVINDGVFVQIWSLCRLESNSVVPVVECSLVA